MTTDFSRRRFLGAAGAAGAAVAAGAGTVAAAAPGQASTPSGKKLKIVAISCSPHKDSSTAKILQVCLEAAKQTGPNVETELIELAGKKMNGLVAAGIELEPGQRDDFPALVPKLADPAVGGILIGTPVYFGNMTSLCKEFLERCMAFRKDKFALRNKVAGVLALGAARNGGQELTIQSIQAALFCQQLIVVGQAPPSSHPGAAIWNDKSNKAGVTGNEQNVKDAKALGERVAQVAAALAGAGK